MSDQPTLTQRVSAAWRAFRGFGKAGATAPASSLIGSPGEGPTLGDVPRLWSQTFFGPGQPITPYQSNLRDDLRENEPRTFQYTPNVNAQISPRIAYGLTPFWRLKQLAESVPEVSMCRRLLTEELRNMVPQIIKRDSGEVVIKAQAFIRADKQTGRPRVVHTGRNVIQKNDDLRWMTVYPDRRTMFQTWVSRFAYSTLVYDAGCFFMRKEGERIVSMRALDGSTLFCIIDQNGEQPMPPQPAFAQILHGQVRSWIGADHLWYRPRNLRVDAPYGITAIEDSMAATELLEQMWAYETAYYTEGNMPEGFLKPDEKLSAYWTIEKLTEYERQLNARMIGKPAERRRWKFLPPGVEVINPKKPEWHDKAYAVALEKVSIAWGVHPSEIGQAPGQGLGGKGFQEKGEDAHVRMGIGPLVEYIEAAFNDVLNMSGFDELEFELTPVGIEIDRKSREEQAMRRWEKNLIPRNRALEMMDEPVIEGPEGEAYFNDSASMPTEDYPASEVADTREQPRLNAPRVATPAESSEASGETEAGQKILKVVNTFGLENWLAFERLWEIDDLRKHCGVCEEDDEFYGARVSRVLPVTSPWLGANRSEIVAVRSASGQVRPAMWKPFSGEWDALQDWIGGAQYLREEAAYLIDRALGLYLCPVAWATTIDGENGAVILYARGKERREVAEYMPQWVIRAAVFDYIIGQTDRAAHNWLTHPDDEMRPILIDHGLTFPTTAREVRSAFAYAMQGETIPADLMDSLRRMTVDVVWQDVQALVGEAAAEQAQIRLMLLIQAGSIPPLDFLPNISSTLASSEAELPSLDIASAAVNTFLD